MPPHYTSVLFLLFFLLLGAVAALVVIRRLSNASRALVVSPCGELQRRPCARLPTGVLSRLYQTVVSALPPTLPTAPLQMSRRRSISNACHRPVLAGRMWCSNVQILHGRKHAIATEWLMVARPGTALRDGSGAVCGLRRAGCWRHACSDPCCATSVSIRLWGGVWLCQQQLHSARLPQSQHRNGSS